MKNPQLILLSVIVLILFITGMWFYFSLKEPISKTSSILSQEEARLIAAETQECSMAGILTDEAFYNENSKTWWIDLERTPELEKDGCNPACVVNEETKIAEVNWRCTGLISPEN